MIHERPFLPSFFLERFVSLVEQSPPRQSLYVLALSIHCAARRVINYFNLVEFSSGPTEETRYFDCSLFYARMRSLVAETLKEIHHPETPSGNYRIEPVGGATCRLFVTNSSISRVATLRRECVPLFNSHDFGRE